MEINRLDSNGKVRGDTYNRGDMSRQNNKIKRTTKEESGIISRMHRNIQVSAELVKDVLTNEIKYFLRNIIYIK